MELESPHLHCDWTRVESVTALPLHRGEALIALGRCRGPCASRRRADAGASVGVIAVGRYRSSESAPRYSADPVQLSHPAIFGGYKAEGTWLLTKLFVCLFLLLLFLLHSFSRICQTHISYFALHSVNSAFKLQEARIHRPHPN